VQLVQSATQGRKAGRKEKKKTQRRPRLSIGSRDEGVAFRDFRAPDSPSRLSVSSSGSRNVKPQRGKTVADLLGTYTDKDIVEDYVSQFKSAASKVTTPNILLVGQKGVGRSAMVNAAFGSVVANSNRAVDATRPVEYRDARGEFNLWDTKALDPSEGNQSSQGITYVLTRQSKEKDVTKHVHAIWYIIGAPVWQAHDGSLVKRLLSHAKATQTPVFVIINKADTMTSEQLESVKSSILATVGGEGHLTGRRHTRFWSPYMASSSLRLASQCEYFTT
jgi:regulator of ribosome biosynthesis